MQAGPRGSYRQYRSARDSACSGTDADRFLDTGFSVIAKRGSIVGDRFSKDIVKNIYPIDSEKNSVPLFLNDARKSGFIKEMTVDNRSGYGFNNITTAEVAYEMTLAEHRRKLHRASAEWYEEKFKEALNPYYVLLAHHWEEALSLIHISEPTRPY